MTPDHLPPPHILDLGGASVLVVVAERRRQVEAFGHDFTADDARPRGHLIREAHVRMLDAGDLLSRSSHPPDLLRARKKMVQAAALALAEIDRIDRQLKEAIGLIAPPLEQTLIAVSAAILIHRARCPVEPHALLADDLGLDALDRITVACALDEAFSIELSDAAIADWQTVADIARSVERLTERQAA